jgi:hypothetical protein
METDNKTAVPHDDSATSTSPTAQDNPPANSPTAPPADPPADPPTNPPANSSGNAPANPPTSDPAKPKKGKTKSGKRTKIKPIDASRRFDARCAAAEKSAEQILVPVVVSRLDAMREVHARYNGVAGQAPTLATAVTRVRIIWSDSHQLLKDEVTNLQHGLGSTVAGRAFVTQTRARTPEATARAIRSRITPEILAHNKPVYKAMISALDAFEKVDAEYNKLRSQASSSGMEQTYLGRMLDLSLRALGFAIRIALLEQTMKHMAPVTSSGKSSKSSAK